MRNFVTHDVEQRTDPWYALRVGRVCASRVADMLATIKSGEAAGRRNLRAQLVLERLTGRSQERRFQSQEMLDGAEREGAAVALYEATSGVLLQKVGFVSHPTLMAGASPDGVVGDWDSFVEVKSPIAATHLEYLKSGRIPDEYYKQMLHLAWLTNVGDAAFVSFQPDFPEALRLKIVPVFFTEEQTVEHGRKVEDFLAEVDRELETIATLTDFHGVLSSAVA